MKNKILIIAALAFAINAGAQNQPITYSADKSVSMYRNIDGSHFSPIKPDWEKGNKKAPNKHLAAAVKAGDYFCMKRNKMYVVVNGTSTCMDTYRRLPDGCMVMPYGALISSTGKVVHLKNGERVDVNGSVTLGEKENNPKEQAEGAEN